MFDASAAIIMRFTIFQSTRPRRVRLLIEVYLVNLSVVSIHAPTWGATVIHINN